MQTLQFSVTVPQYIALKAIGKFSRKAFYTGPLATVKLAERANPEMPSGQWVRIHTLMCGNLAPGMITGLCSDTSGGFSPEFVVHASQVFTLPKDFSMEHGHALPGNWRNSEPGGHRA